MTLRQLWILDYMLGTFILISGIHYGHSYNIEDKLPLFKYGPKSATFGFSVAQHRITTDDSVGAEGTMLVVGAPTADPIASQLEGTTIPVNPGGVFYCPVSTIPTDCSRVEMDAGGDEINTVLRETSVKSNQWLGVSLKSQGPGKFLVSCAHRYTRNLFLNMGEREEERVCGKCFLLNATGSRIEEVDPKSDALSVDFVSTLCDEYSSKLLRSKARYGYLQAGTSISLEGDEYLLGAPGAWRWTGGMFGISMPGHSTFNSDLFFLQPDKTPNISRTPTCEGDDWTNGLKCVNLPLKRDSYMGFSVATSNAVTANSNEMFYAAGAPRGNNTGAVVLFKKDTDSLDMVLEPDPDNIVVGTSIASSFGYSIAFSDINGDSLDDLIVGAPQYYEYNNKRKAGGAVYVYINDGVGLSGKKPQVLYGPLDSYFGHSVAALGDIDQDGFEDFAVGSPYEDGHGVVHIYRGSPDGNVKSSQAVKGSSYPFVRKDTSRALVGFGASLSGEVDSDGNKYPDLLIGSFSDHVALFRSRPIISVNMTFEVDKEELDLEEKECTSNSEKFSCFRLRYCFEYKAKHGEYTEEVPLKYTIILDSIRKDEEKVPRTSLDSSDGFNSIVAEVTLPRAGKRVCPGDYHEVLFSNGAEDRLSTIGVEFEFDLNLPPVEREEKGRDIFQMINDPVLDADFEKEVKKVVRIKNSCGDDGCQSNLKVNATMPEVIIVGDDTTLPLTIKVSNPGEEAHQAYVTAVLPPNVDVPPPSGNDSINCYAATQGEVSLVRCDIGNPYKRDAEDEIVIPLGVSRLTPDDKTIQVKVQGFTSSQNPDIPEIILHARIIIEQELTLTAYGQPQQVRYEEKNTFGESAMNETADIGPPLVYSFDIKNEASTPAQGVGIRVRLPIEIFNGKWLLYLVETAVTAGGSVPAGSCNSTYVNNLQLEPSLPLPGRYKREVQPEISSIRRNLLLATLFCGEYTRCVDLECSLDIIPAKATTSVILQLRLWEASFLEEKSLKRLDLVYVNTTAVLTTSEDNVRFKDGPIKGTVQTTVDHDFFKDDIIATFPWWYILIAVILLLLLYILIIFLCVKCGFFRRKRYPRETTQQAQQRSVVEE